MPASLQQLIDLVRPLAGSQLADHDGLSKLSADQCLEILSVLEKLVSTLNLQPRLAASFHDGMVHDPLGAGAYAFEHGIVDPLLGALVQDELPEFDGERRQQEPMTSPPLQAEASLPSENIAQRPSRPVVIHVGAQPNNSPHAGTLVVFCFAFSLARRIRDRLRSACDATTRTLVSVNVTFVDTAPVKGCEVEVEGKTYQRSYRDVPDALETHMADYDQVFRQLSAWSDIPFTTAFQCDFFAHPQMPSILQYIVTHHERLGKQLSPKYGALALRSGCPEPGCGLAEKHGRLNMYGQDAITFHCPFHGRFTVFAGPEPSCTHRSQCTNYAGTYQETFLYRPLAEWSASTGLAIGRTPHILYAPLIVDWSGAKLSKSLYVAQQGYDYMKLLGSDSLCSYAQLRHRFGDTPEGLRRILSEVDSWFQNPKRLFRAFSVEYFLTTVLHQDRNTSSSDKIH